ncbi:acyltransferase family protein [Dolosicoccus paucivorans]|uniref:acyltransferase family protein n=1 Tax=Dolosicoccus paucivorans TaxID=84521 RepID=UPI0008914292|nr:acyltransferase family protein [Dolosicoccus paucivorans]SDI66058.1 Peptidoglycan/LPS O-acetylase OafA/YrhL, contains acyltransferase and SGNH-hydrolase domains [Dolosicoccus paucivorans]
MKRSYVLDRLKALSILFIICYHLWPSIFPGGFLFVNTFLVLAGFFAVRRLEKLTELKEIKPLLSHIGKVVLRLWIPLFAMIAVVISVIFLSGSLQLKSLHLDTLTSLFFLNNWYQLQSERSYFMDMAVQSPFAHLWYVAIYFQSFLLSAGIIKVTNQFKLDRSIKMFIWLGLLAISQSLYFLWYTPGADPSNVYYSLWTRFSSFAGGVLLYYALPYVDAVLSSVGKRTLDQFKDVLLGLSLFCMIGLSFIVSDQSPLTYLVWLNYFNLLTLIFVWAARNQHLIFSKWLDQTHFHRLGLATYSIYLWYYPLIVLAQKNIRLIQTYLTHYEFLVFVAILGVGLAHYFLIEKNTQNLVTWKKPKNQRWDQGLFTALTLLFLIAMTQSGDQKPIALFKLEHQEFQAKQNAFNTPFPGTKTVVETTEWAKDFDQRFQTDFSYTPTPRFNTKALLAKLESPDQIELTPEQEAYIEELKELDPELFDMLTLPEILYASSVPVTYFGDSLAQGNAYTFRLLFAEGNAYGHKSLQIWYSYPYFQELMDDGELHENVVINLGTNAGLDEEGVTELVDMLGDRTIYFVNTTSAVDHLQQVNDTIKWAEKEFPNVHEIDWYTESLGHADYYIEDDIHLNPKGADYYVALVARTMYEHDHPGQ